MSFDLWPWILFFYDEVLYLPDLTFIDIANGFGGIEIEQRVNIRLDGWLMTLTSNI